LNWGGHVVAIQTNYTLLFLTTETVLVKGIKTKEISACEYHESPEVSWKAKGEQFLLWK